MSDEKERERLIDAALEFFQEEGTFEMDNPLLRADAESCARFATRQLQAQAVAIKAAIAEAEAALQPLAGSVWSAGYVDGVTATIAKVRAALQEATK